MENAQLITLSRATSLARQMDIVANNVANMNTTGYKSENLLFEEFISPEGSAESFQSGDRDLSFVLDDRTVGNFATGTLETTGSQFDVAIQGEGFFAVQTPAGERYTRAGSFTLDSTGQLTTHDGNPVLGDGGAPILFEASDTQISISSNGTITSANGEIGRLRVVNFEDPQQLNRVGSTLFSAEDAQQIAADNAKIVQFSLEGANVDAISQISQMIEVQRAYDQLANIMREQNDLRETAIQRLGRVQVNA